MEGHGTAEGQGQQISAPHLTQKCDKEITADAAGRISNVSAAFCDWLGVTEEAIVGQPIGAIARMAGEGGDILQRTALEQQMPTQDLAKASFLRCDGTWVDAEILSSACIDDQVREVRITVLSTDPQRAVERSLRRSRDFLALLAAFNEQARTRRDEDTLLQTLCDLIVEHTRARLAWVGRPDESGWIQTLHAAGPATGYLADLRVSTDANRPEGQGGLGRAWRTGKAHFNVHFSPQSPLAPRADAAERHGLKSGAALPLRRGSGHWGTLAIYVGDQGFFDEEVRAVLLQLAQAVTNALDYLDLRQREHELSTLTQVIVDRIDAGIVIASYPGLRVEYANRFMLTAIGAEKPADLQPGNAGHWFSDTDAHDRVQALAEQALEAGEGRITDVALRRHDGSVLWADVSALRLEDKAGKARIIWTYKDETERHEREEKIAALSRIREALLANTTIGIDLVRYPERVIIEANRAFLEMLDYADEPEKVIGRTTAHLYPNEAANRQKDKLAREIMVKGSGSASEVKVLRRDGTVRYLEMHGRLLDHSDPENPVIVWTSIDVTEKHRLAQELNRQTLFDPLTGLHNRRALDQHLRLSMARARRRQEKLAVGLIDVDDFKPVNERYGHAAGDRVLQQIAVRLQQALRSTDLVVRLGGDEFAILLEGLPAANAVRLIEQAAVRLRESVGRSFDIGEGRSVELDITMGIAVFPNDGNHADELVTRADLAMQQLKAHKVERTRWWQIGTSSWMSAHDTPASDAFSKRARDVLEQARTHVEAAAADFAVMFFGTFMLQPDKADMLSQLSEQQVQNLRHEHTRYLRRMLAPDLNGQDAEKMAWQVGEVHALMGVSIAWISDAMNLFSGQLRARLEGSDTLTSLKRYALAVFDQRMRLDLHTQMHAGQAVQNVYNDYLLQPLAEDTDTAELIRQELEALAQLPGILGCQLLRPDTDGRFSVEGSAGRIGREVAQVMTDSATAPVLDSRLANGQGLINAAWLTGQPQWSDNYMQDARTSHWHGVLGPLGVNSKLTIPLRGGSGTEFVLTLEGAYPWQFSTAWMRGVILSLEQRWHRIMMGVSQSNRILSANVAEEYRQLLHNGHLRMVYQPVIDLRSGALTKVEALARLERADGVMISPGEFLPALREPSLETLFREGLQQSLGQLSVWLQEGINVSLAINAPPSTLRHADCPRWIEEALRHNDVAPERLTIELLETQDYDEHLHEAAVRRIANLGVLLAIDDLGSGYSSLHRLTTLPFDIIKVDQGLIQDLALDPLKTLTVIRSIIAVGREFAREVVLEGIEYTGLWEAARILGAQFGQGFGIAYPMRAAALGRWVLDRSAGDNLPTDNEVSTYVGALTLHWCMQQHHMESTSDPDQCQATAFFEENALDEPQAATWHLEAHMAADASVRARAEGRLIEWLLAQARSELEAHVSKRRPR